MTHEEKVEQFRELLRERGFWISNAIPPACHMFWALGIKMPPPYFLSFWQAAIYGGVTFGVFWTLFMRYTVWHNLEIPAIQLIVVAIITGICAGFLAGAWCRFQARRLRLGSWAEFPNGVEGWPPSQD